MKQVFVSYVYEDRSYRSQLEHWADSGQLGAVKIIGEAKDVRQSGETGIARELKPKLDGSSALIVIVGQDSHSHDWVRYEVDYVQSARKPVIAVRIPNTTGAAPLSVRRLAEVPFTLAAVKRALQGI